MNRACRSLYVSAAVLMAWCTGVLAFDGFIGITNGYFYDTTSGEPFVPHGIAYQTWNRPLGVWQTASQIDYDLDEMVKMGANSIRVDFVWQHIEEAGDNIWSWTNYEYLVQACEQRNLRIFALIGYQWPPNWFPEAWYTMHPPEWDSEGIWHGERWLSDIINYEHPDARAQYAEWLGAVAGHFKESKAIAGWIVGNESGYLGLWSGLLDGYDPETEASFQRWVSNKYGTIENANAQWGTDFGSFADVSQVEQYRAYGPDGAIWADMIQFREDSIADFTAVGALGARQADTNHLISYSTVGMQWGEEDWRYHAEDRGKITRACMATNAPIDFFSVNNYPWSMLGHESQNGQWGISYTKKVADVPVMYSETGFTSSETMWPDMNEARQGPLVRNALWESLEAGAIGTHIFSWMDRPWITDREKGFGILYADRRIKPAFWDSRKAFNLMDQTGIQNLLMDSKDPTPDIAFLWTDANDSQYNRYECEMQQVAGALERLGYEPNFINLQELANGAYTNYALIILPRNMRVENTVPGFTNSVLNFLLTHVIPSGVHIMATADLPGMQDPNGRTRPAFNQEMKDLFGIDVSDVGGFEAPMRRNEYVSWNWQLITVDFNTNSSIAGYHCWPQVWKYSDEAEVTDGILFATMDSGRNKGFEDSNSSLVQWDGTWGNVQVRSGWGWALDGNNMAQMWGDSGMWYDKKVVPFGRYTHSAWLRSNSDDPLAGGQEAYVAMEWYDDAGTLLSTSTSVRLTNATPNNTWVKYTVDAIAPANTWTARCMVCIKGPGSGSVYVDHKARSPAVVVKDHGTAKAGIFLFSAGDQKPDGDLDENPDDYAWRWRSDYFGALVRDYFGVAPVLSVLGTNGYLCLADYRTLTNGATLWQVKNYYYDASLPNGGADMTFTLSSDLFSGKTIRGFEQGCILEENSDGVLSLTLAPDGMEMLLVSDPSTDQPVLQIADAPILVHPLGEKSSEVSLQYDTAGWSNLTVYVALVRKGTNGAPDEYIKTVSASVSGTGTTNLYVYAPDADTLNGEYLSTAQGADYVFEAWLEDANGTRVGAEAVQETQLAWGVTPSESVPTTMYKGETTDFTIRWEDLYESLPWQLTPMERNEAFPSRVAVFRSRKTEELFPGHADRINAVCDWLESMGYVSGNPLDVAFDHVVVTPLAGGDAGATGLFQDDMDAGTNTWTAEGLWHQTSGTPSTQSTCWVYNDGVQYGTGLRNQGALISPWISLTNAARISLSFKSWYETENTGAKWDKKLVQVSTDGSHWTTVLQIFGPDTDQRWLKNTVDLSAYAGRSVRIRFQFDTVDQALNYFTGWAVDDVQVMALPANMTELFADTMEATTNWTATGLWNLSGKRSVSGASAWGYNNGTNYFTGASLLSGTRNSGSLVSGEIHIPELAGVWLSFQSWYETEDTDVTWDQKLVYVSTNNQDWQKVVQVTGPMQEWTSQSVDLSAYAGKTIRVKLVFDTVDGQDNQHEGWYVDDVEIAGIPFESPDEADTALFDEAVEQGTNGWVAGGLWHITQELSVSPSHSWGYNNGVNYNTGRRNSGSLTSPLIVLTNAIAARLQFQSWFETEDAMRSYDRKTVQLSTNGNDWINLCQISGTSRAWTIQSFDLSAYAGQSIRLRFFFDTMDAMCNNYRGWFVDDIQVLITESSEPLFEEDFSGSLDGWECIAGSANWMATNGVLRTWRIGNDDNICTAGDTNWDNYTLSADIRYNTQGPYFNDAELYLRYQDRDNFVKVGIHNYYGAWRLKYSVRVQTNIVDQGWIHSFAKTNRPVEKAWYNLKVNAEGNTFTVYFDGEEMGSFTAEQFPKGKIGLGVKASQLGIWEPQKGYFFVDDDEYSYYSADENAEVTLGSPLNLDWGYLDSYFPTLILPATYVMSDIEVSNVVTWLNKGLRNLIATDGGVAAYNEQGEADPGRIEPLFGVAPSVLTGFSPTSLVVVTEDHYVTKDRKSGDRLPLQGTGISWQGVTTATALGTITDGAREIPALTAHVITNNPEVPKKVFSFNFDAASDGQLTGVLSNTARQAFEWARGQAHKVRVELKYQVDPNDTSSDLTLKTWDLWVLGGSGEQTLSLDIPDHNIMTGDNLYWIAYVYPSDATNAWEAQDGFYTSANDGTNGALTSLAGVGLQVLGVTGEAYAGRYWDLWLAYNTRGAPLTLSYGIKKAGTIAVEDLFENGLGGWTVAPSANVSWSVTTGNTLRASVVSTGSYSYITRNGLDVAGKNITMEYDVKFNVSAQQGGLIYRGRVLYVNPQTIGWDDTNPQWTTPTNLATGVWHHVMLSVREGDPCWKSDLYIDGEVAFLNVPIESTTWGTNTVGLLSPFAVSVCEWDNFRVSDEVYSFTTNIVNGAFVPTSSVPQHMAYVPDWDPDHWEFESSSTGENYEWYARLLGSDGKAESNVTLSIAPRIMVEQADFPTNITAGETVELPVEWESTVNSTDVLHLQLIDLISGGIYADEVYALPFISGADTFAIPVASNAPSSSNYLWKAYISPAGSASPFEARVGMDDTYRFNIKGDPVGPETCVAVTAVEPPTTDYSLFRDNYLRPTCAILTWAGSYAYFNGQYTGVTPPEGVQSFYTYHSSSWAGWGTFQSSAVVTNMSRYAGGSVTFWVRSAATLKVELEGPRYTKSAKLIASTGNAWQQITIPLSQFSAVNLSTMYGLFLITSESAQSFYVDDVRWVMAP